MWDALEDAKTNKQTQQPKPKNTTKTKPTKWPNQNTKQAVVSVLQVNSAGTPLFAIQESSQGES